MSFDLFRITTIYFNYNNNAAASPRRHRSGVRARDVGDLVLASASSCILRWANGDSIAGELMTCHIEHAPNTPEIIQHNSANHLPGLGAPVA
jgi:hypothetical protein